jgi:hypothetical protein
MVRSEASASQRAPLVTLAVEPHVGAARMQLAVRRGVYCSRVPFVAGVRERGCHHGIAIDGRAVAAAH